MAIDAHPLRERTRRAAVTTRIAVCVAAMLALVCGTPPVGAQTTAAPPPAAEPRPTPEAPPLANPTPAVAPAVEKQRDQLDALLAGELPVDVPVEDLLGIALDDPATLASRQSELSTEVETARARIAEQGDVPEQELAAQRLELEVATKRLAYIRALRRRMERMTDASRRILPSLGERREALRSHAELLADFAESERAFAQRLEVLAERSASGMLVGFVSERRSLAADLSATASALREQTQQLSDISGELAALATKLETEGRRVRSLFQHSAASETGQQSLDALFQAHLRSQRQLRKGLSEVLTTPGRQTYLVLEEQARTTAADPHNIGTTSDAEQVLEVAVRHQQEVDALIAGERAGVQAWELAFENELVTVLSDQASSAARANAYRFSSELLDDVTAELVIAWDRFVGGLEARRAEVPTLGALLTTRAGQDYLLRGLGILGLAGLWLLLRRRTPRITVSLVKALARLSALRGRAGLLVRASGLVQALLPAILGLVAFRIALRIMGPDGAAGQTLNAIAMPLLIYLIGRQALLGVTRRITPGRPALIELRPSTLDRLQRTYATLGVVVAFAYIVDGVARVAIGDGRVVAMLSGTVIFWVVVWAIWAALQWRLPLAQSWRQLLPEAETPDWESRIVGWMARHRRGFLLSPIAALRLVITPVATFVGNFASATDFVQSLRAKLLRRRSKQIEVQNEPARQALPQEYLEAFPLYPILGEDDALLVQREELLSEVLAQLERWSDSRTDGSLVLVGEKGAGKTTLAAQIGRRLKDIELVQHTLRGKPTSESEIVRSLSEACGNGRVSDLEELTAQLRDGDDRVILLDEAHNCFLRHIDGYAAYNALVDLVNATSSKVFWVLIFNSFTWRFLNESRGRVHFFRRLLDLPKWTVDEIQQLIRLRNKRAGFDLRFDEVLLSDDKSSAGGLQLVEEPEGYFRLLWESSGGNPRIATQLWLSSLNQISDRVLSVGLFREANSDALSHLQDDLIFSLAAICQHENLSSSELARVLNVSEGFARFAVQFLSESGFLEAKDGTSDRYTLAPAHYRAVLRTLRSKHLLFD